MVGGVCDGVWLWRTLHGFPLFPGGGQEARKSSEGMSMAPLGPEKEPRTRGEKG